MSLPLGHAALGLTAYDFTSNAGEVSVFRQWKVFTVVVILSNLPDMDVLLGLLYSGNGELFHRGPTHSLVFAFFFGMLYATCAREWKTLPSIGFACASLLIGTHLLADFLFTDAPISLFWPFGLSLTSGFQGWADVVHSIIFETTNDFTIIMLCCTIVILKRLFRLDRIFCFQPVFVKKTIQKLNVKKFIS